MEIMEMDKSSVGKESVLLIDGWKNSSNNSKQVVTMLQTTENDFCFLDAHDFTDVPETGDELKIVCDISSEQAEEKYGSDVYAAVSDNAKNMLSMGRKSKDIIDKEVAGKVKKVLIQFKKSDLESLVLKTVVKK